MKKHSDTARWTVIVLAAGRDGNDPLAAHFGVTHKCLLPVAGVPMLQRVVSALADHPVIGDIVVSIEHPELLPRALGDLADRVRHTPSGASAAQSAYAAVKAEGDRFPILLTTGDHALLDHRMLDHFLSTSSAAGADLTAGVARAEVILAEHPGAKRTFLTFGGDRVSGCNLYGLHSRAALKAIELWQVVEANRKNPLAIARAFGPYALLRFVTRTLTLASAFALASRRLGITARPVELPMANAAVDIDKPADHELVERILASRG